MPSAETSHWINAADLSKDDIRWAQVELHNMGLYNGSLDGVVGPGTQQALAEFQKINGLKPTATLDQQTADALIGSTGVGLGSSLPPKDVTNSSGTSDFRRHTGQK
jgi:peptidoglycan hydrolase-like protein with peptidoglycan-binding domain